MSPINTAIESSEPYDGGPYQTESGWTSTFSLALSNGCMTYGNCLDVYTDNDGRQVKVKPGQYFIRGHIYTLSTDKILPVAAQNGTSYNRSDLVIVRLDTVNRSCYTAIVQGSTPTDSTPPVPPTLTQIPGGIWEEPLKLINVLSGYTTLTSDKLLDRRTWAGSGTNWKDYVPQLIPASGNNPYIYASSPLYYRAQYRLDGSTCFVKFRGLVGHTSTGAFPYYTVSLPILPHLVEEAGAARVQNTAGHAMTDNTVGTSGVVNMFRSDHGNLDASTTYWDSFNIFYEIAPGVTPSA